MHYPLLAGPMMIHVYYSPLGTIVFDRLFKAERFRQITIFRTMVPEPFPLPRGSDTKCIRVSLIRLYDKKKEEEK